MEVRKNAASLSDAEWARFMGAVVKLKHTFPGGSNVSVYDSFVALHRAVTGLTGAQTRDGAHGGPSFLSWHREYICRFERALQQIDSAVTLPYWNWGLGALEETTSLFVDERIGRMGAGGASNFEIETGYLTESPNTFNPLGWTVHPSVRPFGTALQRNPTLDTGVGWPTATTVNNILSQSTFSAFRPALEGPHGTVHIRVGRDMRTMTSPNDPIFFLHHAQVDRIWAKWQVDHPGPANFNPLGTGGQGHRVNDPMWPWDGGASQTTWAVVANMLPTFAANDIVRPANVIDHHALEYCYDDEPGCPCQLEENQPLPTVARLENLPTIIRGEDIPTAPVLENLPTTIAIGEEDPGPTTLALGEEGPTWAETGPITTLEDRRLPIPGRVQPFGNF